MPILTRVVFRIACIAADVAQSIIAGFGAGHGDPAALHEAKPPVKATRRNR
jgi:hypothetical protein